MGFDTVYCSLLYCAILRTVSYPDYRPMPSKVALINNEFESIWKEYIVTQWSYCLGISLEGLRKPCNTSVKAVSDEIRTEHLQNTSLKYTYHLYARPLS
jgi:hypothetical protein